MTSLPPLGARDVTSGRPARPPEHVDAVVVGGGIGGLVAARTLVHRGLQVVLLEASDRVGGPVRGGAFGSLPVRLDLGAESFAARGTAVTDLAEELGLDVVSPAPLSAWGYAAGRAFPLPKAGVLGIPSVPWAADVRRAIGWPGVARAALDRLLPRFVADTTDLGTLVRSRLGRRVADRLVAPVASGVHSAPLDRLDVAAVAPGLLDAFARAASLSRAVGELRAAAPAGSAVRGIDGGIHAIVEALTGEIAASAEEFADSPRTDATGPIHAAVRVGQQVDGVERVGAGWQVTTTVGDTVRAPRLVVTAPQVAPLLAPWVTGPGEAGPGSVPVPTPEAGADIWLATLLLDAPELDDTPRGSGLLVAPDTEGAAAGATSGGSTSGGSTGSTAGVRAKALTHATAKWPWLADRVRAAAGPGVHVVRLSYGRIGTPTEVPTVEEAARDASALLGVDLTDRVRDHLLQRWDGALPPPTPAYRAEVGSFAAAVGHTPGLAVTGGWVAGTGLAAIVGHAQAAVAAL